MSKPSGKRNRKKKLKKNRVEVISVHCANCRTFVNENNIKLVQKDIDPSQVETLTFICPNCNTQQKSKRF